MQRIDIRNWSHLTLYWFILRWYWIIVINMDVTKSIIQLQFFFNLSRQLCKYYAIFVDIFHHHYLTLVTFFVKRLYDAKRCLFAKNYPIISLSSFILWSKCNFFVSCIIICYQIYCRNKIYSTVIIFIMQGDNYFFVNRQTIN